MSIAKPYVRTSMIKDVTSPSSVNATVDEMYDFSAFLELPNLGINIVDESSICSANLF